jgi:hypothetical protein
MAMPSKNPTKIGYMGAAKGGKAAGEVGEWKSRQGYDASLEGRHPTLAKAVDIGKRVVGVINEKTAGYVKDTEGIDRKLKGLEEEKEEHDEETKQKPKSKSKSKSKKKGKDEDDEFDFGEEDDEDGYGGLKSLHKGQKILPGKYKSAYGDAGGISDSRGYKPAFKSSFGANTYEPAYRQPIPAQTTPSIGNVTPTRTSSAPERFNLEKWQSVGFPNTLPQSARGSLFRPAPPRPTPQPVVPMVRQPYQPSSSRPQIPVQPRAPEPMPRMGGSGMFLTSQPTIVRPQSQMTKFAPPTIIRAAPHVAHPTIKHATIPKFTLPNIGLRMGKSPLSQSNINTSIDASHITILGMPAFKKKK